MLDALGQLATNDQRFALLADLCTAREITEMAQRLDVAARLKKGQPYALIQKETGASATTVARVSKSLQYGEGGYELIVGS